MSADSYRAAAMTGTPWRLPVIFGHLQHTPATLRAAATKKNVIFVFIFFVILFAKRTRSIQLLFAQLYDTLLLTCHNRLVVPFNEDCLCSCYIVYCFCH